MHISILLSNETLLIIIDPLINDISSIGVILSNIGFNINFSSFY